MLRTCNRAGCGQLLTTKTGAPDFRKHFCSRECKNEDSKEKKASRRKRLPGRKCPPCGRKAHLEHDTDSGVSQDTSVTTTNDLPLNV